MKKTVRKLMCLVLVLLLTATMTTPAMGAAATGSGTYEQYSYSWLVECTDTYGFAQISADGMPAYVKAYAECTVYHQDLNVTSITKSVENMADVPSNYIFTSATAGNTFIYQGNTWTGEITKAFGKFWIANENVVPGVYDYPG